MNERQRQAIESVTELMESHDLDDDLDDDVDVRQGLEDVEDENRQVESGVMSESTLTPANVKRARRGVTDFIREHTDSDDEFDESDANDLAAMFGDVIEDDADDYLE